MGNNTDVLSENTPIGNENVSTTEKMNREQTSLDNKTEAKNTTEQQGEPIKANKTKHHSSRDKTLRKPLVVGSNATNQSQQQRQNNTNPLSNIPVLGELFGGK